MGRLPGLHDAYTRRVFRAGCRHAPALGQRDSRGRRPWWVIAGCAGRDDGLDGRSRLATIWIWPRASRAAADLVREYSTMIILYPGSGVCRPLRVWLGLAHIPRGQSVRTRRSSFDFRKGPSGCRGAGTPDADHPLRGSPPKVNLQKIITPAVPRKTHHPRQRYRSLDAVIYFTSRIRCGRAIDVGLLSAIGRSRSARCVPSRQEATWTTCSPPLALTRPGSDDR